MAKAYHRRSEYSDRCLTVVREVISSMSASAKTNLLKWGVTSKEHQLLTVTKDTAGYKVWESLTFLIQCKWELKFLCFPNNQNFDVNVSQEEVALSPKRPARPLHSSLLCLMPSGFSSHRHSQGFSVQPWISWNSLSVDQAGLKPRVYACLCFMSAGTEGKGEPPLAVF